MKIVLGFVGMLLFTSAALMLAKPLAKLAEGAEHWRAKAYYLAVYYRGPRWKEEERVKSARHCAVMHGRLYCHETTQTVKVHVVESFPDALDESKVALSAPTAAEIDGMLSAVAIGPVDLDKVSLEELEAKADRARGELRALRSAK